MAPASIPRDDAEWASLISAIKDTLPATFSSYPAPEKPQISRAVDHTLLALTATEQQVDALCAEALEHRFATVCVRLGHVKRAVEKLQGDREVGVACVVGFHEGTYPTHEKEQEARDAVGRGATELDMVLNYPQLKEGKFTNVFLDVQGVRNAAPSPVLVKVILETSQLSRDEIIAGSVIASVAGADYIKTSTGFNGQGATVDNVALMRAIAELVGKGTRVKASGGVRSREDCVRMLQAGAGRIGTSAGVKIMQDVTGGDEVVREGVY